MAKQLFANNAKGKLNAGITNIATTLTLQAGQGALFPTISGAGDWFKVTLIDTSGNIEVVLVTAHAAASDTFGTIVRAQEGTANRAFLASDKVEMRLTAAGIQFSEQVRYAGVAGGTADALTATVPGPDAALFDGMQVMLEAASANATNAPTLNLTMGVTATGPKAIIKGNGLAVSPGDIAGAGHRVWFVYQLSVDRWVLLNAATFGFTTGDVKVTYKSVADAGFILANDGSIGSAASGATTRANADTLPLYTLLWNNVSNTWAPVATGRGGSAAADFAANKAMTLPKALGRELAVAGAGAGLTARALGENLGSEDSVVVTHSHGPGTLSTDAQGSHAHNVSMNILNSGGGTAFNVASTAGAGLDGVLGGFSTTQGGIPNVGITDAQGSHAHNVTAGATAAAGVAAAGANISPRAHLNIMIKL